MVSKKIKVSIIIRVKNEEKWINSCLRSVFNQVYKNYEVIIVNNNSEDNTIKNIKKFNVKIINIKNFFPGKAINYGIRKSQGRIIVCLSGHCIPKDKYWLQNLIKDLNIKNIAGVYGRQEPLSFSSPNDKRDLMLTFGLDKKVQKKDYFFHNANSAFRRELWEKFKFNEKITNIEDREWGKRVISNGFKIIYEPKASVFHYHGIHQDQKKDRALSVSNLMEKIDGNDNYKKKNLKDSKIFGIIPFNSNLNKNQCNLLINKTLEDISKSTFCKDIAITTSKKLNIRDFNFKQLKNIFIRPAILEGEHVSIADVTINCLEQIEKKYGDQDIIIIMDTSHPFRPSDIVHKMLKKLKTNKSDSIIAVYPEKRNIYELNNSQEININEGNFIPRHLKEKNPFIGLFGVCFITYAKFIKENSFFGNKIDTFVVEKNISNIQIRNEKDFNNLKLIYNFIKN